MDIDEISRAYQDVFFQYQIPKEIHPSAHVVFITNRLIQLIKARKYLLRVYLRVCRLLLSRAMVAILCSAKYPGVTLRLN